MRLDLDMYQVIDQSGQTFGPANIETLRQWAIERRLTPDMTVIDQRTYEQGIAGDLLRGLGVFLDPIPATPVAAPVQPTPVAPVTPITPISQEPYAAQSPANEPAPAQAISYAYKGSNISGEPPTLQNRAVAFGIDFVLGMSLYVALHGAMWSLFLPYATWDILGYVDYFVDPLLMLFFLTRDATFSGQSIGKRIARIKVIDSHKAPCSAMGSILRNAVAAPIVLLAIPYVRYAALPLLAFGFLAECFMVMTQGNRLGDKFSHTTVVNE